MIRKKILISLVIVMLITGLSIVFSKFNKKIVETYTLNQQGLMRNQKNILDEKFDEKGNLIYYKYKVPNSNDTLEFNFKYKYDSENRIIEIGLDNKDYVQVEYSEDNKIVRIYENIFDVSSKNRISLEFSFDYLNNNEVIVEKIINYISDDKNEYKQHYILNYKCLEYNNKECILLTETYDNKIICEVLYEKGTNDINYSNFYELLNIVPLGYSTGDNFVKNYISNSNSLLTIYPIFFNGNIIYSKNFNKASQNEYMTANSYYDNLNRLLKQETYGYETNQISNYMYKSINLNEYYEYIIIKNYNELSTKYTYIKNKIYLNDKSIMCKKETLKSEEITEKEYDFKMKKFDKYFKKENNKN